MEELSKKITILLVDNKDSLRRSTRHMLQRLGYGNVIEVGSGDIALEKLRFSDIDLIICDTALQRMTGVEMLRSVRKSERFQSIPFIMVASEGDYASVAEAGEEEVDAFVVRPFTQELLAQKILKAYEMRHTSSPIEVHLNLGIVYMESRQFDKALEEVRKAQAMSPKSPRVLVTLGRIMEAQGGVEEAKKYYHKTIQLSPKFLKGHDAMAKLYKAQGNLELSVMHLREATAISPRNMERQLQLGKVMISLGLMAEAREAFTVVMSVAKNNFSDMAVEVGEAYLDAGMLLEAQEILKEGIALNPNDLHLYNRLGIAYRKQKKFSEAVKNYELAIEIDPENENLYFNLGRVHFEGGDWDKAAEAMKEALRIYPDFQEAKDFLEKKIKL